jgi:hypothetical protein
MDLKRTCIIFVALLSLANNRLETDAFGAAHPERYLSGCSLTCMHG